MAPFRWLCLLLALAAASATRAQPFEHDPLHLQFSELARGVWLAQRPVSARIPVMGNGVIILNGDHVVVVDGAGSPRIADQVIAKVRELTGAPVRYLVISHWHGDHNLGAHRFREAWPELAIVAHRFTRQAMLGAPMDYVEESKESIAANIDAVVPLVEAGTLPDGSEMSPGRLRFYGDLVDWREVTERETRALVVTPPTLTFEDALTLHGEREIQVRRFGNGNTAGDAVTWLPAERILVTGDVVVRPTPYGFGSYPRSWARVLRELVALEPAIVVTGHGGPLRDTTYLETLAVLLDDVADQVEALVAEGLDLEAVRGRVDLSAHRQRLAGDDDWLQSRFDAWFATPIVEAAYNVATGIGNEALQRKPSE